jgi:hypothetical protein
MKDLFTIQTESGQLWLDIKAQLDAKDAQLATQSAAASAAATAAADAHAAAIAALADQHAADLAQAASDQATAVEAALIGVQKNLDTIVEEAEPPFAALLASYPEDANLIALGGALGKAKAKTTAARRAKLQSDLAAAQAAVTATADKLAALA